MLTARANCIRYSREFVFSLKLLSDFIWSIYRKYFLHKSYVKTVIVLTGYYLYSEYWMTTSPLPIGLEGLY